MLVSLCNYLDTEIFPLKLICWCMFFSEEWSFHLIWWLKIQGIKWTKENISFWWNQSGFKIDKFQCHNFTYQTSELPNLLIFALTFAICGDHGGEDVYKMSSLTEPPHATNVLMNCLRMIVIHVTYLVLKWILLNIENGKSWVGKKNLNEW